VITAYRACGFWQPLRTEPSRTDGRYHRAAGGGSDEPPTQYVSLHPLGPIAEWIRWNRPPRAALAVLETAAWALQIPELDFVRISFDNAGDYGVRPDDLVSDDHAACQQLADELRGDHIHGAIVPSAALPGTENLVIFDTRVPVGYLIDPVDPTLDVPVGLTAWPAGASGRIYDLVRHRGQLHPALEAFRAGDDYVLDERSTWPP
jgi:RES domain